MAYQRKTIDLYELVYDYGYGDGLEVISSYYTIKEARIDKEAYIENEGICPAIRKRRIRKEKLVVHG